MGQPKPRAGKASHDQGIDAQFIVQRANHNISRADISVNAIKVLTRLQSGGYNAFLVGGGVRDLMLRHAAKDFDIATDARPNQIKKLFRNCRLIGRRFRLAHIHFGREIIEVATFRAFESDHEDQHHNESGMIVRDNVFGSLEEDAWRRDFTINALYYNTVDSSIIDFTGGFKDLHSKTLRLIGDPATRYREDPVRMLRAIRFIAKLDFEFEPATLRPLNDLRGLLADVPHARLLIEITKLFHGGYALQSFQQLRKYNLFEILFPTTSKLLDDNTYPSMLALIEMTLGNTDRRIAQGKPVTPAFLFAVMLWQPLQSEIEALKKGGMHPLEAIEKGMNAVLHEQRQHVTLPKRYSLMIREIWMLQYRLPRRYGKRPFRTLSHPRFRAAYDFLTLRAQVGEVKDELAEWWTKFQHADQEARQAMIQSRKPRKRNPNKAKPNAKKE